jgi:hypothetical protein
MIPPSAAASRSRATLEETNIMCRHCGPEMLGNAYIAGKVMRDSNKRQKHAGVMGCFLRNQSSTKATHLRVARWALVPAKFPANSLRTRCISHETALTVLFTVDYKAFPEFPANSLLLIEILTFC